MYHPILRNVKGKFPTCFRHAQEIHKNNRSPSGKIASNTFLTEGPGCFNVTLYATDIVTFYSDGSIRLDSGRFQTATTRDRMRQLGVHIYTEQGVAYVAHGGRTWTFSDRMVLTPDGNVTYDITTDPDPEKVKRRRMRNRRRGDYVPCENRQSSHWYGGNVPEAFLTDSGEEIE